MGRQSSIKQLAPDILEQLHELLRDPRITQLDATARINEILEERGEEPVTKSAVNRYKLSIDQVGKAIRESREMAEIWIGKLGAAPQSQVANLTSEIIRNSLIDLSLAIQKITVGEDDPEVVAGAVKMIRDLAISHEKIEKAVSETTRREEKLREQARKEALEEAAKVAEGAAKGAGVSDAGIAMLVKAITEAV
ncbi:phage protein Gp27 family protein [Gynuella sp.]|uniref:phage protein Gp27 family protein n=1 Tax=Gynuella sp. TaxID=2969146 RepID=UPI003D12E627